MKRITDELIREKKVEYIEKAKELSKKNRSTGVFFKVVKELNSKDRPVCFNVSNLFPGATGVEVAKQIVDYFGAVSDSLPPLDINAIPSNCPASTFGPISKQDIVEKLIAAKKPSSICLLYTSDAADE